jgi:hypothetical protein
VQRIFKDQNMKKNWATYSKNQIMKTIIDNVSHFLISWLSN